MVLSEGPDPESMGCGFNAFKEIDEINALIKQLREPDLPFRTVEKNMEQFKYILTQYQDQHHLLDPHLENILDPMLEIVKNENIADSVKHNVFKYLYILMSVKTYKKTVTYLPHEVMDLLPVLRMLEKQDTTDNETWETRYVLLIWLSIISKIPFPLSRLEIDEQIDPEKTIIVRIVRICQLYCFSKDSCSIAAVFLIANFLTRSDVKKLFLDEMIMWCLKCLEEDSSRHGSLAVLASILKHCAREDLKPYTQKILDSILKIKLNDNPDVLVRKFAMKVIQRIGFVLLRTKLASWRYQRASKPISLVSNVPKTTITEVIVESNTTEMISEIEDEDIPPVIEDIIEYLIQGMRDKVIIIRWSAAKGIARITARLPIDLADDVVGFVLNLFSGRESDSAWHGGCLALAELGRRGLLLPHRLRDVIPLVLQALVFDEPRAYGSVGSIIRDAACYVCWSFARAFEPHVFLPHVKEIAATLLTVTCFDREINCRRAASAAFQENVGRQGNFPHGIDIFTAADYFEVGVRSNAFLKISVHIAQFEEYTKPLIDHLIGKKVNHWDTSIRELAAKALHNLTPRDPHYMVETVIPSLLNMIDSIDLNVRHGSVLAIGEILEALYIEYRDDITITIGQEAVERIKKMVRTIRVRGQFKGLGGELMKQACATLIKKCALIHFPVHSTEVVADWQDLLEESLSHEVLAIRSKAAESHTEFFDEYYTDNYTDENARSVIINRYLGNLQASNQILRIGFAQAIGHFPLFVIKERTENIIESLIACTQITDETGKWAESRKEALHSLTMICQTLGVENSDTWKRFVNQLYDCYLLALKEYTTDSRGDIGAWVREAAMTAVNVLTNLVSQANLSGMLTENLMANVIGGIAQQAVERIDRIRAQAGAIFNSLIHSDPQLPNIPYHEELMKIFPSEDCKDIDWKMESVTFPRFIKMLTFTPYTDNLLRGIIFSVGGVTESLVKYSSFSLFSYLKEIDEDTLKDLTNKILNVCEESHKNERMIISILAFLDRLLSSGSIQIILDNNESEIPLRMLCLLKKEMKVMHNTAMTTSSIKIICQLLQVRSSVSKQAFAHLSLYLCNKYKYLRKATATRIYETLTLYGEDMDISEEDLTILLNELNETDWEKPVEELRPIRNHLCELMKVPAPTIQKKAQK
ncbi:tubulin-specific chaperone D [Leptopilina boulardi]|uniref:tubulin-specific chaperone D n=1 Tax=Leptopilina boulardi TaxID=63433 RepID=UPI0021F5A7DB|nr:tubulin-specific chaperone D [Leptopilina boulardi]XP_051165407.1 tubulin-specific chaperone D [Leptopilina boulardi]XP_051165408.1 tubulin-specific chaperone D [Leptopilina boulardi]